MQRSTWRSVEDSVHKIDMPPVPPPSRASRVSKQIGSQMETFAAIVEKKLFWIMCASAILFLCMVAIFWLWYSGSVIIDDITEAVMAVLGEMRMPRKDSRSELAMVDFAPSLVSSLYSGNVR